MKFGSVRITDTAVETHRDTYLLKHLTVVSVRRPFFAGAVLFAIGGLGFALSFSDVLYWSEIIAIGAGVPVVLFCGRWLGQIQLLSRDLRGSELSGMLFGSYNHLNRIRGRIITAMDEAAAQSRADADHPY